MNFQLETEKRVAFIKDCLKDANADGVILGLSGGKDSALVAILAKMATPNVLGVIMPCSSQQNYKSDKTDALLLAKQFEIETVQVDLTKVRESLLSEIDVEIPKFSLINIAPRLRMITLYAIGQTRNYLVAGTGNKCEAEVGYFTKWGDGAHDFNPVADLTVQEVLDYLKWLNAPESIWTKAPSAGLYDGQTDEGELGITYAEITAYLKSGTSGDSAVDEKIKKMHDKTQHKRELPKTYKGE